MFQTVLVPVDFSGGTEMQVRVARDLALASGAALWLLHVREPWLGPKAPAGSPSEGDFDLLLEAMKLELERDGARVTARSVRGSPVRQIVDTARECGADLIVMGAHGRTGLRHLVMGSVADGVLRGAPCPVLTLRLPS